MSADEKAARRPADPLIAGVSDGVAAGYDALEHVLHGLRESVRQRVGVGDAPARAARRATGSARGSRPGLRAPSGYLVDEVASLATQLLDRGADLAQDASGYIDERPWAASGVEGPAMLDLRAAAGEACGVEFRVTNTGASALTSVRLGATELIGGAGRIADAVGFEPEAIERARPGGSVTVEVSVRVPDDAAAGTYRGVVAADPGEAWAVLELTVPPPGRGPPKREPATA